MTQVKHRTIAAPEPHREVLSAGTGQVKRVWRVSNLLKLKGGGEALRDAIDEVGKGERSTSVSVRAEAP